MMVLISYDVSTIDPDGRSRLRKVSKECQNHAQRVQNSVFEADLDYSSFLKLKDRLINLIDKNKDSLNFTIWEISGKSVLNILETKKHIILRGL